MRQAALKSVGRRRSLPPGNASHAQFRDTISRWSSGGTETSVQGNAAEEASPAFTIDRKGNVLSSQHRYQEAESPLLAGYAAGGPGASGKVPYSQNWNLTFQFEAFKNTVVEVAYVGNKGTHLFLPFININPRDVGLITQLESQGIDVTGNIADPLGRTNLQGAGITITRASVFSPYLGFDPLNRYYDPSGNSIRHAFYVDVSRRLTNGLTFTANYTFGKSIDTASDASPDTRTLSTGQARQQVSLGGDLRQDRAVSTFDVANNFNATGLWDLPFGHGRQFFSKAPKAVDVLVGGWTISGVLRMPGGLPFLPFITDPNKLGGVLFNRYVRPDIVPGVPLRNPLWKRDCPIGSAAPP
jgi:hypothetical protein